MNNIVDVSYLALELTKIFVNGASINKSSDLVNTYKSILCDLLDIQKLPDVEALEKENAELREKLKLKEPVGLPKSSVDELLYIIDDNKGDMEPIVYSQMVEYIRTNMR